MSRFSVVVFPGSNCDHDCEHVLGTVFGQSVDMVWHSARSLPSTDCVVLPGGFAHGDYLRTGAIARFSPVMDAVMAHARAGKPVIGICNGFQVLCESGLLPGALVRNLSLNFICRYLPVRVDSTDTPFTSSCRNGSLINMPIAHGEGRYVADSATLARLERNGQVVFRYADASGETGPDANPNGSLHNIAGICNEARNVVGLMPHPERAAENELASADGRIMFESVIRWLSAHTPVASR
jgi:phosphoribosylformylglycinamidine synthase I